MLKVLLYTTQPIVLAQRWKLLITRCKVSNAVLWWNIQRCCIRPYCTGHI